jgi:tRNA pseudouridine55 synthase
MTSGDSPEWWRALVARGEEVIPLAPARARPPEPPRPADPAPKTGILVVDKPGGLTSHDVVQRVRRAAGERRVGHAGTLDPMATGVLVVCLGSATRVVDEVQAGRKTYEADVWLGRVTDTYDAEGQTVREVDASAVTREAVEAALPAFRGTLAQVPPMFSAVHHEGTRLYELARQGREVEREARQVEVYALRLEAWRPPVATLTLTVSRGTYVRSIAHELGEALGVGAHLSRLVRLAVGPFDLAGASTLDDVAAAFAEGWWPRLLHAMDAALLEYDAIVVAPDSEHSLREGRQIEGGAPTAGSAALVRAYGHSGRFIGLVEWDAVTGRWQPNRIFPPA